MRKGRKRMLMELVMMGIGNVKVIAHHLFTIGKQVNISTIQMQTQNVKMHAKAVNVHVIKI